MDWWIACWFEYSFNKFDYFELDLDFEIQYLNFQILYYLLPQVSILYGASLITENSPLYGASLINENSLHSDSFHLLRLEQKNKNISTLTLEPFYFIFKFLPK